MNGPAPNLGNPTQDIAVRLSHLVEREVLDDPLARSPPTLPPGGRTGAPLQPRLLNRIGEDYWILNRDHPAAMPDYEASIADIGHDIGSAAKHCL
jgi:hypothetical protein